MEKEKHYENSFLFKPTVHPEMVKNIGIIGDKSTVSFIIKTYDMLENLDIPLSPYDKYSLPLFALKLNLAYKSLDKLESMLK
ncbi:MAG: hypothetical protein R3220_05715 [Balneolaceae bacterium]|nr:hypothetical protein [Balneolaceae bacterium]